MKRHCLAFAYFALILSALTCAKINWPNLNTVVFSITQGYLVVRSSLQNIVGGLIFYYSSYLPSATKLRRLFLHVFVCPRGEYLGRYPPGPGTHPPGPGTPPGDGYCCGRYASYWNEFLLSLKIVQAWDDFSPSNKS